MLDLREIILSLLEEEEFSITMRPVRLPWAKSIFLALIIPREQSEMVLEFIHTTGSKLSIREQIKYNNGSTSSSQNVEFDLIHPSSYEDLRQYLEKNCYKRHTVVEFEDNLDFDYAIAGVRSEPDNRWIRNNEKSRLH
ncbi:MAG: hypothetical protein ACXAEN_16640 [Candidatus Thorarchaeota archaeon]